MSVKDQPKIVLGGDVQHDFEHVRKPSGGIIIDGHHIADTMKCCHCGYTWIPVKGSGRLRGFCTGCNHVTCGAKECDECDPFERKLERIEKAARIYLGSQ